jgi:hypothetical protein
VHIRAKRAISDAALIPNLLDNKEVFLHACATVAFALRAVADAVRTRTEKLPYYRVHSVAVWAFETYAVFRTGLPRGSHGHSATHLLV